MRRINGVEARWRPPYNAPPSRRASGPSPDRDKPLTNYDFALARRQALMLVAGQAAIAAAVAVVCAASIDLQAGFAAAIGGGIGTAASLVQVASGFRRSTAGDARAIARGFYRGEALKIAVTVMLFVLALRGRHFAPGPMLAGYVATFVAYWVALARTLRAG
jgi:ATP synthase protein I